MIFQALQRSSYTSDEVKTGKIIIESAGKEDDSSDEEVQSETFSENINELLCKYFIISLFRECHLRSKFAVTKELLH